MVNWLLLLAVGGLVATVAAEDPYCSEALASWKFEDFKKCRGNPIQLERGTGNIDLSTWAEEELKEIFNKKEFVGGFIISNSQITGKGIYFTVGSTKENARIVIENNSNLEELSIERTSTSPLYIRVSGHRQLKKKYITMLKELKARKEIRADSHIQAYHECNLNGIPVTDAKSVLANCNAIYGDLIFDATTVFPENDWNSIKPLEYVQGCLRIIGTSLQSWNDITFLQTTTAVGGCDTTLGHEISGNQNMCIQPPMARDLKKVFDGMKITGNSNCIPECTSGYLHQEPKTTCVIIIDDLIINEKTTDEVLKALKNVEEIRGNLQIANTNLTDFNYLPKLQKLNTNKMDSGPVIHLQRNNQLKSFDLPLLNASGLLVERDDQLRYHSEDNSELDLDPSFRQRIGANDSNSLDVTQPPTTQGTTATTLSTEAPEKLIPVVDKVVRYGLYVAVCIVIVICFGVLFYISFAGHTRKWWKLPENWECKKYSSSGKGDQASILKYDKESEWHKEAKKLIDDSEKKIKTINEEHNNNKHYTKLTLSNHQSRRVMPGLFEKTDYETRKDKGEQAFNDNTLDYPAGKDGVYGLAFQEQAGKADTTKYRTQCDKYGFSWFKSGLQPIYPESFKTTAKLMAKLPCAMISEKFDFMEDKGFPIGEFGIVGREFKAVVNKNKNDAQTGCCCCKKPKDPVPSRGKKEERDVFWLGDQIPQFEIHRYRKNLNSLEITGKKYTLSLPCKNMGGFVCRLVEALMNLPMEKNLKLTMGDVRHFLKVIHPDLLPTRCDKLRNKLLCKKKATMSDVKYAALNKTHVRIVGEVRGDFDALRRAINIPSLLEGEEHPLLQYNWVFLGNYTGSHSQSLETLMFLLALQFLYGRDCIVLLRGVMEFKDTSEKYGFKETLMARFGDENGLVVWEWMMKAVSELPLNCQVLYGAYCSSGGFTDADIGGQETEESAGSESTTTRGGAGKDKKEKKNKNGKNAAAIEYRGSTTPQELDKLFSLPNVTVRDYLENADTGAGYYYGERVLEKIARETGMCTFFSTMPMMGGVGFFSDSSCAQLITISSVRHLQGHGGQKTLLAAVAEINGDTNIITMHMILHEDEGIYYDQNTGELTTSKPDSAPIPKQDAATTATHLNPDKKNLNSSRPGGSLVETEAMKQYRETIMTQMEQTIKDEWRGIQLIVGDATNIDPVPETAVNNFVEPGVRCIKSTRVRSDDMGFYHANNFMQESNGVNDFILAQVPKEGGIADFWRIMYDIMDEKRVDRNMAGLMFILTPLDEVGPFFSRTPCRADYGPKAKTSEVSTIKVEKFEFGTKYTVTIVPYGASDPYKVDIMHYEQWEAGKTPMTKAFLEMTQVYRDRVKLPVPVVCVSRKGTGRAGVLAAALAFYNGLEQGQYTPLVEVVSKLRNDRAGAVENFEQYCFINSAIIHFIQRNSCPSLWQGAKEHYHQELSRKQLTENQANQNVGTKQAGNCNTAQQNTTPPEINKTVPGKEAKNTGAKSGEKAAPKKADGGKKGNEGGNNKANKQK